MEPLRVCLSYPANFQQNWAGLAVLFSRQIPKGSQDLFFSLCFQFNFLDIKGLSCTPIFLAYHFRPRPCDCSACISGKKLERQHKSQVNLMHNFVDGML